MKIPETQDIVKNRVTEMQGDEILPAAQSPMEIIAQAVQRGAGEKELAILQKMFEFDLKVKGQQAKECFFDAVASFKANPPSVLKDKENTQFKNAKYTSLGNLLKTVNPALGKHGLSASFDIEQTDKLVTVSCILSHRLGHSQKVSMSAPPDTSGGNSKNPIQQIKSTITYLRAATFEAVTGLAATDSNLDDDGNAAGKPPEYINPDQVTEINDLIKETSSNKKVFLKVAKAESVETILVKNYAHLVKQLNAKKNLLLPEKKREREPGEEG